MEPCCCPYKCFSLWIWDLIAWFDSNKRLFLPNHLSGTESRTNWKLANTNIWRMLICYWLLNIQAWSPPYEIIFKKKLIPTWSWKLSTFPNFSYQHGLGIGPSLIFWLLFNKYIFDNNDLTWYQAGNGTRLVGIQGNINLVPVLY